MCRRTPQWRRDYCSDRFQHWGSLSSHERIRNAYQDVRASCTARSVGIRPCSGTQLICLVENSKAEDKKALLRQVVVLDLRRILSRLRSRHAKRTQKTSGKQPLIIQLNQALYDKGVKARYGFTESNLKAARGGARTLQALFNRLETISDPSAENFEIQEVIGEIIKTAHDFTTAVDLEAALQAFSGDPTLKGHLPEAVGKLGRYYSAPGELVCAARDRKCRVFQHIQVEPFQIRVPASVREANHKVHAEIQLLFFYELHPDRPRPMIICSSKSACYLCNLFFHLHGRFHVPRTHGKLYDKWILPDWLEVPVERRQSLGTTSTRLKVALDDKIQGALKFRKRSCPPNESVLLPLAYWPSTSAFSENLVCPSVTSVSTIRPKSSFLQGGGHSNDSAHCAKQSPTPPDMRIKPCLAARSDIENTTPQRASNLAHSTTEDPQASSIVPLIIIRHDELPCSRSITLLTPSLHLQLDELALTLDFVQVMSGHLSIAPAEECPLWSKESAIVNIEDIPTTSELQLNCPHDSNRLSIQLQNARKRIICIEFSWVEPLTSTHNQREAVNHQAEANANGTST